MRHTRPTFFGHLSIGHLLVAVSISFYSCGKSPTMQPDDASSMDGPMEQKPCEPLFPFAEPILLSDTSGKPLHPYGVVSDPMVITSDRGYRMWFTATDWADDDPVFDGGASKLGIAYATSTDGIEWSNSNYSPEPGRQITLQLEPQSWYAAGVETASVVARPGEDFLLFYTGDKPPEGLSYAIGIATSHNGTDWLMPTAPSVVPENDWEMPVCLNPPTCSSMIGGILEPTAIFDSQMGMYRLWYAALGVLEGRFAYRMGYAVSSDGVNWEKSLHPVFEPGESGAWDDEIVSHFSVSKDASGLLHLFYFGSSATQTCTDCAFTPGSIGYATSQDGIEWTRYPQNPVIRAGEPGQPYLVGGPSTIFEDGHLRLWFFDSDSLEDANRFSLHLRSTVVSCAP